MKEENNLIRTFGNLAAIGYLVTIIIYAVELMITVIYIIIMACWYLYIDIDLSDEAWDMLEMVETGCYYAGITSLLVSFACFLIWIYQCHKQAYQAGDTLAYQPPMAVIGFLIPVANLFMGYHIVRKLFTYTAEKYHKSDARQLIKIWWTFIVANFIWNRITVGIIPAPYTIMDFLISDTIHGIAVILQIIALALFIRVIRAYISLFHHTDDTSLGIRPYHTTRSNPLEF